MKIKQKLLLDIEKLRIYHPQIFTKGTSKIQGKRKVIPYVWSKIQDKTEQRECLMGVTL